jgi:hypothetical protein
MNKCFQVRAEEHNPQGRCCCNCVNQKRIVGHPWNKEFFVRTPVNSTIGYGCTASELDDTIIFFETQHGQCELHDFKRS